MSRNCELCALVRSIDDAPAMRAAGATRIYLDVIDTWPAPELLARVAEEGVTPVLDEVCREADHARVDPWLRGGMPAAVGNVSELALARERDTLVETRSCIPAHNTSTLRLIGDLGARLAWLSPELSLDEACELARADALPLGVTAYGRPRIMTCEHCALQVAYDCDRDHAHCPHRSEAHWLVNIDDRALPVRTDACGRSRIYLDEPLDLVPYAAKLAEAGVARLLVDAASTSVDEVCDALARLRRALAGESVERRGIEGLAQTGVE